MRSAEQPINDARHAEREDRIHVVPQLPFVEHLGGVAAHAAAEAIGEAVEKRIEVVVVDDECAAFGMVAIVFFDLRSDLQSHGRFARAFFAEDNRRGRVAGVAVDFIPTGVERTSPARAMKDEIGLRIFIGKRVGHHVVVGK